MPGRSRAVVSVPDGLERCRRPSTSNYQCAPSSQQTRRPQIEPKKHSRPAYRADQSRKGCSAAAVDAPWLAHTLARCTHCDCHHRVLLPCYSAVPLPTCAIHWEIGAIPIPANSRYCSLTATPTAFHHFVCTPHACGFFAASDTAAASLSAHARRQLQGLKPSLALRADKSLQQAFPLHATFGAPDASCPSMPLLSTCSIQSRGTRTTHVFRPPRFVSILCP